MRAVEDRVRYQAGFGVDWPRLPVFISLAAVAAVGLAWCLKSAFVHGWYLIFLLPIFGGLALGGVLSLLVGWTRCRNRWLAGTVGVLAGLIGYLGYYQFCLLELLPPQLAWRVDILPSYISFRMQTDIHEDVGKPDVGRKAKEPSTGLNWFTFAWELAMVVGAAGGIAWARARHAYSTELERWMRREKALIPGNAAEAFLEALSGENLSEFLASMPPANDAQTACPLTIEYAIPDTGSPLEYPVFASLGNVPVSGKFNITRLWSLARHPRRTLLRQAKLEVAEVLTLRPLFPELTRLLAAQHAELNDVTPGVVPSAAVEESPTTEFAQVTPVPEPYRRKVRSKGYALWVNLVGLTPAVYFFGGGGLVAAGIWLATEKAMPVGWAAVVAGAVGVVWGGYTGLYCLCVAENRWIDRRLRREFALRPDPLVDPRDPASQYVSLIPRESFAKVQLTMSSDLLLMRIDERERRLLMEGDCDRYRIPAGAIAVCEPQCFFHPIDAQHRNELWMIRLMVRVEEGLRELLLSADSTRWTPMTNARRRRTAEDLCGRINALRG